MSTETAFNINIETEIRLGSPLLNEDFDVVGIHVGSMDTATNQPTELQEKVKQQIFNPFSMLSKNIFFKMLKGKTDNELWLERINKIPETEFQLIGSGGYGKVYKIKVKTESKEFAVKMVKV